MKLSDYSEQIRLLIDKAFRNRLGRMGITSGQLTPIDKIPTEYVDERHRMDSVREVFISETGTVEKAYEKLVEELTFTLFNRLAALKVMEAHTLFPEIITQRETHGGRSFAHLAWLEQNPEQRAEEAEGLVAFIENQFSNLSAEIPLFSTSHPYHLVPTAIELSGIITAFNQVETDNDVIRNSQFVIEKDVIRNSQFVIEKDVIRNSQFVIDSIWRSDDVLGWLYESYNNQKKADHKASKAKTEYNKVSIQSQVYTPRWVVQFLVDNSLGKLYLEMFPDSNIRNKYKIANSITNYELGITEDQVRNSQFVIRNSNDRNSQFVINKKLHEIKLIDPATGSGNFLLYAFDLFYDLYLDQIENYGADYDENKIAKHIIENNLYGVDLDDRAIQLAQLGLYVKAKRKKRSAKIERFNVVSSDFILPDFDFVLPIFRKDITDSKQMETVESIWNDLKNAHKFGSLVRLNEKIEAHISALAESKSNLFSKEEAKDSEVFKHNFLTNLQHAFARFATQQGNSFLVSKTQDAITFLQLLTQKYDVAVANPPYTDSSDFGAELKTFIDANYKQPYKFNINLYATFIKRCCELTDETGKVAIVHPPTFMYIKTFEDVRKYMIDKMHISLFVEWGYLGMFNATARVDAAMYILDKTKKAEQSQFIKLNDIYEGKRYDAFVEAYEDLLANRPNKHNISLPQSKLKIIDGWPFIYWISDGFREKFKEKSIEEYLDVAQGLVSSDNERFLRYWWETNGDMRKESSKWIPYQKGGSYCKWYGNNWVTVNWANNGKEIKEFCDENGKQKSRPQAEKFYFLEGITYCSSGSKGASFRYMPVKNIISGAGPGIFPKKYFEINYTLGYLNSNLSFYIAECLNPTVNTTQGDLKRIPFVIPNLNFENGISNLSLLNVEIKKHLCSYRIIETNFDKNPLHSFTDTSLKDRLISYLNYENTQLTTVLLNEAIINEHIYGVYELSAVDRAQVEAKMGVSVGALPITEDSITNYELGITKEKEITNYELGITNEDVKELIDKHIQSLEIIEYSAEHRQAIVEQLATLYQSNNDLEEFCIRNQVNPLDVCLWFREANILPAARAAEITLEFLADAIRTILMDDEDGIVPLVGLPGEPRLLDRLEQHCLAMGFTSAQFMQLDSLLGRPVNEYIEQQFFKNLSDHLNLFMYLPKTPFIWHLSSGANQGFEAYIIIYKWNRDSLFKLKSQYLRDRVESLDYRLINLQGVETAAAQNEKETIRLQLREIEHFTKKIDELIAESYNPILDDGVGKNIAPLQKKGMLKAEVLKANQLVKYLNADW